MPRFVFMSDTHNQHDKLTVPDGDVLVHAGDALVKGTAPELEAFADWFTAQPHKIKLYIPGNHDIPMAKETLSWALFTTANVLVATHDPLDLAGIPTFASSWTPGSYNGSDRWVFHYVSRPKQAMWDYIPIETRLLITHGPALGFLDETGLKHGHVSVGCPMLAGSVLSLAMYHNLEYHVFGHIHDAHGYYDMQLDRRPPMHFRNVAICDDNYTPVWGPTVVDIE